MSDATRKPPIFLTGRSSAELHLRVRKQGDDLLHHLKYTPDLRTAFEELAKHHDEAARKCRRLAGLAAEVDDLSVVAELDRISVTGPIERIEALVREGLLERSPFAEEDERANYRRDVSLTLLGLLELPEALRMDSDHPEIVRGPATREVLMGRLRAAGWWEGINPEFVQEVLDLMVMKGEIRLEGEVYYRAG